MWPWLSSSSSITSRMRGVVAPLYAGETVENVVGEVSMPVLRGTLTAWSMLRGRPSIAEGSRHASQKWLKGLSPWK